MDIYIARIDYEILGAFDSAETAEDALIDLRERGYRLDLDSCQIESFELITGDNLDGFPPPNCEPIECYED